MKTKEKITIIGRVRLVCKDKNRKIKWDTGWLKNTITTVGLAAMAGLLGDIDSQTAFTYLAIGTDDTAESETHTELQAEITDSGLARSVADTITRETTNETNDTLQLVKEWTASGAKTIEEIGIFNAASSGVMLGRKLTTTKEVGSGETLSATYQIIIS